MLVYEPYYFLTLLCHVVNLCVTLLCWHINALCCSGDCFRLRYSSWHDYRTLVHFPSSLKTSSRSILPVTAVRCVLVVQMYVVC